ncbi:helix-turn-helix domain-containing protein [Streptomyces albidoflavus]|uniref:helix-turn-helix domain-containing protein n=1 Tax=Streptomyces albidoflavus TaxID=1886 RepID=UPI000743ECC4|nr:helix-turn-helix domain-containing protein [Streptomyces albidoflavus]KUL59627.1 hypothetical protein ADL32_18830 [Streptomyces albidoflavus]WST10835.1 helix-turn-helix domain-containing protein [Streptomyces albidoflavus]
MATPDLARLARYVKDRRLELGLARKLAAAHAGMSKDTWRRVEEGEPVREMSYAKMDPVLGWAPGSTASVLAGEEPVATRPAETPGAEISEVPPADRDSRARDAIRLAAISTAGGLTAEEIRELSDRAVQELRERGII